MMNAHSHTIDPLHGPLAADPILFALPIAASSMLQQLFTFADTAVVGRFADAHALAAVGTNSEIVALLVSLSLGLSMGVNVLLARHIGSGDSNAQQQIVSTALLLALFIGGLLALSGQFISRPILRLIHTPDSVLDAAGIYLRLYFCGCPFLLLYDFGAAILRAQGDSRRPFWALTASGVLNIGLNLCFVVVCRLGVAGVALSTVLSSGASAAIVLRILLREIPLPRLTEFSPSRASSLLHIGIPAALQGSVFCFANLFAQTAVNSFGASVTAGSAIATNFEYFVYYLITAFGQTATTFTSQNHAAGNTARCRTIFRLCLLDSILFSAVLTLPLTLFCPQIIGLFSHDAAVLEAACTRIRLIFCFESLCGLYEIPAWCLRGKGFSALPARQMILGICLTRILWIVTVFPQVHTLQCLFLVFPLSWIFTAILLLNAYRHPSATHGAG